MNISQNELKNPPKKYRPLPFWSWNATLDADETLFQIKEMDKVGMGGFFMHARGGLKTEYMGNEWMDNVRASVLEAEKREMQPWGYDENGWPSGFGSDVVTVLGEEYHQKYIYMEYSDSPIDGQCTIANVTDDDGRNMHFYYETNRFYVDCLDSKVTDAFIESTHKKYKEILGEDFSKMTGFFTDEPQLSRKPKSIPWSFILPFEYEKEYGEKLIPVLKHLFVTSEEAYQTRFRYWRLITKLFSENFMKRIYDWCNKNGSMLTGHLVLEETLSSQLDSNGACMPGYQYMHIPGVDKLGRLCDRDFLVPQLASVCAQTGKKQILTESFALCGWDVSFEELKWVLECQMVKGANLLCQHLAAYSLAGIRKRDYPASHFYQNSWWEDYKAFNDFASRVGMLLCEGRVKCDVLLLHNISSAWLCRCDDHNWAQAIDESYNKSLTDLMIELDKNQIIHHMGDELMMETLGSVEGKKLKIGDMKYSCVIVPSMMNMSSSTYELLKEYKKNGGILIFAGEIPSYIDGVKNNIVKDLADVSAKNYGEILTLIPPQVKYATVKSCSGKICDVQYAYREFADFKMHYFVNSFSDRVTFDFETNGKSLALFDYQSGEIVAYPFSCDKGSVVAKVTLEKMGSVIFFVYDTDKYVPFEKEHISLESVNNKLTGTWKIEKCEQNALTLDFCDVYIDGIKEKENMHVIDAQELANSFERKVKVKLDFKVKSEVDLLGETYLVAETPELYEIFINGEKLVHKRCGYFRDKAFVKLDISGMLKKGENKIEMITDFVQPQHIYNTIRDCTEFEAVKNKLWYDREIEEIYILGDFAVKSEGDYFETPNKTVSTSGGFVIAPKIDEVTDGDIVRQGFPFFTGKISLSKTFVIDDSESLMRSMDLERIGAVIANIKVNGNALPKLMYAPYDVGLSDYLKIGENKIEIELVSNFRNLLGPLHLGTDAYLVTPGSFYKNSAIFSDWSGGVWNDNYTFLETGIFLK